MMERFFNTAGPQTPQAYTIDPLTRIDLEDVSAAMGTGTWGMRDKFKFTRKIWKYE